MKEIILQIDNLLGMLEVRGDSVMILAEARKALGAAYKATMKEQKGKEEEGKT